MLVITFRIGTIPRSCTEMPAVVRLEINGNIVDMGLYPAVFQNVHKLSPAHAHLFKIEEENVKMEIAVTAFCFRRDADEFHVPEGKIIFIDDFAPPRAELVKLSQLGESEGALDISDAVVEAEVYLLVIPGVNLERDFRVDCLVGEVVIDEVLRIARDAV